jgi:hypothetical protein
LGYSALEEAHLGVVVHQLQYIQIAGYQHAVDVFLLGLDRQTPHDVIGFIIIHFQQRPAKRLAYPADIGDLLPQVLRHRLPVGFILGI